MMYKNSKSGIGPKQEDLLIYLTPKRNLNAVDLFGHKNCQRRSSLLYENHSDNVVLDTWIFMRKYYFIFLAEAVV